MPTLERGNNKDITTADVYDLLAGTVTPEGLRARRQARRRWRGRVLALVATALIVATTLYWLIRIPPDTEPFLWAGIFVVGTSVSLATLANSLAER